MALLTIDHANVAYLRLVRALADSRRERDLVADAECLNVLYDFIDVAEEIAAIIAPNETESSFGAPMRDGTFFFACGAASGQVALLSLLIMRSLYRLIGPPIDKDRLDEKSPLCGSNYGFWMISNRVIRISNRVIRSATADRLACHFNHVGCEHRHSARKGSSLSAASFARSSGFVMSCSELSEGARRLCHATNVHSAVG